MGSAKSAIQENRLLFIDVASVISAIAVIVLHANKRFWVYSDEPFWVRANIIESVFYFAVPVFFMITGATLIDYRKKYTTKEYFKRRFFKTVIPVLAWSVISVIWAYKRVIWGLITGSGYASGSFRPGEVIDDMINFRYVSIYWFFAPLFCIYLIIPLFAAVREDKRIKVFSYIVLISLTINVLIPFLFTVLNHYTGGSYGWSFSILPGSMYLAYVLIGYLIRYLDFSGKERAVIYLLAFGGLLIHILGTWYLSAEHGKISTFFKGYYNLPCILYSTGVFLLFKSIGERIKSGKVRAAFGFLRGYTFGWYLIHYYILGAAAFIAVRIGMETTSDLYVLCASVTAIAVGSAILAIMKKIPGLKYIVPQ